MITITRKEIFFQDVVTGEYRPYQDGDDINSTYVYVLLSNGYDAYIKASWDADQIKSEVESILSRANAQPAAVAAQVADVQSALDTVGQPTVVVDPVDEVQPEE